MLCQSCGLNTIDEIMKFCDECQYYLTKREQWKPEVVKILFIAESPPEPKKDKKSYFYNVDPKDKGGLWRQFDIALGFNTNEKELFLNRFKNEGYVLDDIFPTYDSYKKFKGYEKNEEHPNKFRNHIINRFSNIINEYKPEKIVFVCKRAVKLLSVPFPMYSEKNKNKFQKEISIIKNYKKSNNPS